MIFTKANCEQLLTLKGWFSDLHEIIRWGGPQFTYPIADEEFLKLLQAPHLYSYVLLNHTQQVMAFGQHYPRLGRHHLGRLVVAPPYRG